MTKNTFIPLQWNQEYKNKVIIPTNLEERCKLFKQRGLKLVTLNGSFDLLHAGHLQIIFEAKQLGDILIVALNTDHSIKQYKNPKRPIIPLEYRLQMMTALSFVDFVTWFDETDPRQLLSLIKPDIHVNGSEYGLNCIEADTVHSHGGTLHIVPLVPGLSTSALIRKIKTED